MVKSIKQSIVKSPYFFFSIIALLVFIGVIWSVWQDIESESLRRVNSMIKDVAVSNVSIVKNKIKNYSKELAHLQHIMAVEDNEDLVTETFAYLKKQDPTIETLSIVDTIPNLSKEYSLFSTKQTGKQVLCFLTPIEGKKGQYLRMQISLSGLHHKIAESKELLHAYVTVVAQGHYVFHPDEKLLGKKATASGAALTKGSVRKAHSDFLKMDVYRYSEEVLVAGNPWRFTANIVNLDFQEYLEKRGKAFLWVLFAALVSFFLIVTLGVLRWRKEFAKRKNVEQQNLALALKNEQQKQAALSTELEILKSGLNPHFLFNAISSLKILVNKKPQIAKEFAVALSNVYRYMLKHEKKDTVTLAEELRFVEDYMQLQKIRFGDKIQLEVQLHPSLLQKEVPPVSVQLLVENALKHTVIAEDKVLSIHVFAKEQRLFVTNNHQPRLSKEEPTGKGIENLQKRYSLLTAQPCAFYIKNGNYIAEIPLLAANSFAR